MGGYVAYLLTGDVRYAHKAAVILHRVAEVYPNMDHETQSRYGEIYAVTDHQRYTGKVVNQPVELLLDADGAIRRGKCLCSHHHKAGIRMGPCRHLLALRQLALRGEGGSDPSTAQWYNRLRRWAMN